MLGLSSLLETARRALSSQQLAIGVTSHNIANASTPGYSRQRVGLVPTPAIRESFGYLGTGVTANYVGRLRDRFLDQQVRTGNATMGEAIAQQKILSQIEASFNEPSSSGLSAAMTAFFTSFQELSLHPEESSARHAVLQQGALLGQTFQRLHGEMSTLRGSLQDDITAKVTRINQLAAEISGLDVEITNAAATGAPPSDLQDQRDLRIEELSTLADISVSEDARGSVMVSVGGIVIASRAGAQALRVLPAVGGPQVVTARDGVPVPVGGGELGAALTMVNTTIPDYLNRLDELAGALMNRVNTVHRAGYGLGTPPPSGVDFFSGTGAATMSVSAAVAGNPNAVAASQSGAPGDNRGALALAGIAGEAIVRGNTLTLSQFYNGLVSSVGSAVNSARTAGTTQELILTQLENQRQATSGVSLDEEMTNLIKYQRAFDAAARLVNTTNDMFQTILTMVP